MATAATTPFVEDHSTPPPRSPLLLFLGFSQLFSVVCFSVVVLFCVIKTPTSSLALPPKLERN